MKKNSPFICTNLGGTLQHKFFLFPLVRFPLLSEFDAFHCPLVGERFYPQKVQEWVTHELAQVERHLVHGTEVMQIDDCTQTEKNR